MDTGSRGLEVGANSVPVSKQKIAIIAAASIAILSLAVAVGTAKYTPALSARVVKVVNTGDDLKVIVQVTNSTAYVLRPVLARLEVWNGMSWDTCRDGWMWTICPQRSTNDFTCEMVSTNRPGKRLRLSIKGCRAFSGLHTLLLRLRIRLAGNHAFSLNPFDPTPIQCADTAAVIVECRAPD